MPMASGCRRGTEECAVPPLGTGMQAIQLSPYRTGVAGRSHTRLRAAPAFHPCSCPLLLSDSGKVVASQSFALNFGHLWWQCTRCAPRRTLSPHTAHERGILREMSISPAPRCILHGQLCAFAGYLCTVARPSPSGPLPCTRLSRIRTTMPYLTACRASELSVRVSPAYFPLSFTSLSGSPVFTMEDSNKML